MFRAIQYALHPFDRTGQSVVSWQNLFDGWISSLWIFPFLAGLLIFGLALDLAWPEVPLLGPAGAALAGWAFLTILHQFWLIRRLHDHGWSGLWLPVISPAPFVMVVWLTLWLLPDMRVWVFEHERKIYTISGIVAVVVLLEIVHWRVVATDGDPGPNRYGPPPHRRQA